jgi:dihydrofolate reductase
MRQIVMFNRVSADGFFGTQDGSYDWVVPDDAIDAKGASRIDETDTILFGRKTYDSFESFWANALNQDPHHQGRKSDAIAAMAKFINAATKIVFSKTRKEVTWKGSKLYSSFDPKMVEELKRAPGKTIMIFGSGSIVRQLTQHDLIDEYTFVVGPILLGTGKHLFDDVKRVKLELIESTAYPSGNVVLRYARKG